MSSNSHLNSSPLEPPKPSKLEQSPNHPQDLSANKSSTKKVLRFSAGPDDLQLVPKNETFMQR